MHQKLSLFQRATSTVFSPIVTTAPTPSKRKIKLIRLYLFLTSLHFLFSHGFITWEWTQLQCRSWKWHCPSGSHAHSLSHVLHDNQHLQEGFTSRYADVSELISKAGCLVYDFSVLSPSPFCLKLDRMFALCPSSEKFSEMFVNGLEAALVNSLLPPHSWYTLNRALLCRMHPTYINFL